MNGPDIRDLLERVHRGELPPGDAEVLLADHMRALPFEDLGFARVDHHRSLRQGFPEVILGLGKTPAEIASIAERIVARGDTPYQRLGWYRSRQRWPGRFRRAVRDHQFAQALDPNGTRWAKGGLLDVHDQLIAVVDACCMLSYVLYSVSSETIEKMGSDRMKFTSIECQ